ncbi:MAG: pentapeptide repeat-containing protein, partial [Actinomycetales bacterium]
ALVGSIGQSAKFGGQGGADVQVTLASALGYLPSWLRLQLPIGVMLLALVGSVLVAVLILRSIRAFADTRILQWRTVGLVAVGAQLLVLPLGAALARSNVYDGVRQFLFIVPPLALLATFGVVALLMLAARPTVARSAWAAVAWAMVGVSVLLPVLDQWRLFPYNYTYANETASPLNDRLPTDYWRTSMRELVPLVPADGATACNFDPLILGLVPIDCANAGQVSPYLDTRGTASIGVSVPPGKYLYLASNRGRSAPAPESGCSVVDQVTRTLHGEEVVMAYVAVCEAPCVIQEAASCAGKSLKGANLDGWNLRGSDFSGADFTGASLVLVDLTGANLTGANLTGANLEQADLTDTRLDGVTATGLIGTPKALPRGYRIKDGSLVRKRGGSS